MKVAIGSDHRGFAIKSRISELVRRLGHEPCDLGTHDEQSTDYPDYALAVANSVGKGEADRGVLVCGTGIGMSITANKVRGVRAALCHDDITAQASRAHNDANVLCLSADLLGEKLIDRMIEIWLATEFEGGRHGRRVDKIKDIEGSGCAPACSSPPA